MEKLFINKGADSLSSEVNLFIFYEKRNNALWNSTKQRV